MSDGFTSMDTAPRDGTVFVGMSVAGNEFNARWMADHTPRLGGDLVPAGWCDTLNLNAVDLLGWRPVEQVAEDDEHADIRTVGELVEFLARFDPDMRVALAGDAEGNHFGYLADVTEERAYGEANSLEIVAEGDEADDGDVAIVLLWPV